MNLNIFKVIFIGSNGVGKTSIIQRKKDNTFHIRVDPTVGAGSVSIIVEYDGKKADLCIWDTAGQERYMSLVPLFVRDVVVAVVVASLADYQSIEAIPQWINELRKTNPDSSLIVAINKMDLESPATESKISINERLGPLYENLYLVSAKDGSGITELFEKIAALAFEFGRSPVQNAQTKELVSQPMNNTDQQKCC